MDPFSYPSAESKPNRFNDTAVADKTPLSGLVCVHSWRRSCPSLPSLHASASRETTPYNLTTPSHRIPAHQPPESTCRVYRLAAVFHLRLQTSPIRRQALSVALHHSPQVYSR